MWNIAKEQLYGNNNSSINRIIENGKFIQGSQSVSNVLYRYFIRKPKEILSNLPVNNYDPMNFYKQNVKKSETNFSFKTVNMSDMRKALSEINKSNSMDYYGLSMKMLFNIQKSILPVPMNIVNLTIFNSEFPIFLKINKIAPIAKDKDFLSPKNYRSINIFSPI